LTGEDKPRVNPTDKATDKPRGKRQPSKSIDQESAAARELDENGLKQESALKALFVATRSSLGWSIPNLDQIRVWLADGIPQGIISSTVTPMLKRKEDMASLSYCDSAVREAHAAVPHIQIVPPGEFIVEGTLEWACWDRHLRETTRKGSPVTDDRSGEGRVVRRGWWRPTRVPPGYDEATGEKLPPASKEDAA
jgi:hypothetical protein